jgi:SSS family solute:Na+ symporter
MDPLIILLIILSYFAVLSAISFYTSKGSGNAAFFTGNRSSPWYAVAYGMIGASLSGVTFISVPGWVNTSQFAYMQMVLGYLLGYLVVAKVLLPLYYCLNLTSIYTYLEQRFGYWSYKTGAFFFLVSRLVGASFRLYLMAGVLQLTIFDAWNIPFAITVLITIFFIWLYTYRGGIKTVVWTDTLQTSFMLIAVAATIYLISSEMNFGVAALIDAVEESAYSQVFFWEDWNDGRHFLKQFFSGAFITIVMTGLDQDMMQKNLTCRNIGDAQKNMYFFSVVLVLVNLVFLVLGVMLFLFAASKGIEIPEKTDHLFPLIATGGDLSPWVGVLFILGLVAAAYSSADSALTALTTSFCVDFLKMNADGGENARNEQKRKRVHIGVSAALFLLIMLFSVISDENAISAVFKAAGYTYGPLLGLYAFGLFTKRNVKDKWVPVVAVLSPLVCFAINRYSETWFNGYKFGFELLMLNGFFTFIGLFLIADGKNKNTEPDSRLLK